MRARQVLVASLAMAWLGMATAHAQDGHGADPVVEHVEHHGDEAHGHDAHGDDAHGHDAHHYNPAADDDHDGTANWRDSTDGEVENEHYMVPTLVWHTINLLILIGVLFFFVRKPLASFLQARADAIRAELDEADGLRRAATERHQALVTRLDHFDEEVERIRATAQLRSKEDRVLLEERAQRTAEQIRDNAQRNIQDEVIRARDSLRRDAVDLAVQLAEQTLRTAVNPDDQRRLARQFLDSLSAEEVDRG